MVQKWTRWVASDAERGGAAGDAPDVVGGLERPEREVAHGPRLCARTDAELGVEHLGEHVELPQHAGAVTRPEQVAHDADVSVLVGRVEGEQLFEPARSTQELAVAQLEPLTMVEGPVLVGVERQEVASVDAQGLVERVGVAGPQRGGGQLVELLDVDVEIGDGKQARPCRR